MNKAIPVVATIFLSFSPQVEAQALSAPHAGFIYQCFVPTEGDSGNDSFSSSATLSCDVSASVDGDYYEAVATGQVSFFPSPGFSGPHANVAVNLQVPVTTDLPALAGNVGMSATGTYWAKVVVTTPPLHNQHQVPVIASYALFADANGSASVTVSVPGGIQESVKDGSIAGSKSILIIVDAQFSITVSAGAGVSGSTIEGFSGGGQAVADPVFEFDQEAFDESMGEFTFELADHYEFIYSEGVDLSGIIYQDSFEEIPVQDP